MAGGRRGAGAAGREQATCGSAASGNRHPATGCGGGEVHVSGSQSKISIVFLVCKRLMAE